MKKNLIITVLITVLSSLCGYAVLIEDNEDIVFDDMKFEIETSRLKGEGLRDWCSEFADLDAYNGYVPLNSDNVCTSVAFMNLLRTIRTMDPVRPSWTAEDVLLKQQSKGNSKNCILGTILYRYFYIKENALRDNLIRFENNTVYDNYINGVWQNPYAEALVLAFAPQDTVFDKNVTFSFPSEVWKTNFGGQFEFDPGDGKGARSVHQGSNLSVSYASLGIKDLKLKFIYGGKTYMTHSQIRIIDEQASLSRGDEQWIDRCIMVGKLEATLSQCNNNMGLGKQPFIYVEGLDSPLDSSLILKSDTIKRGFGRQYASNLFNESSKFVHSMSKQILSDYDFYYVDFQDGTATVEDKAKLLRNVIKVVNEIKSTNKPNIVFGSSMGGLVARYCLRDMELSGEYHGTSVLICQDTPNLGANAPLGILYGVHCISEIYDRYVKRFKDLKDNLGELNNLVHSPAAKQLLYNYIDESGNIDNTEHNRLISKLSSMGFPRGDNGTMRCLAISNGCEQITKSGVPLLEMTGSITPDQFVEILGNCLVSSLGPAVYWVTRDIKSALLSIVPGSNKILLWAQVNPTGGTSPVCHVKFRFKKKILWLANAYETFYEYKKYAPTGLLHYDLMKGSYYDRRIVHDGNFDQRYTFDWEKFNIHVEAVDRILFIPTASALAIGEGKTSLNMADYTYQFVNGIRPVVPKHTPFHDFYISEKSEMHTSFNDKMNKWLKDQLEIHVVGPDIAQNGSKYAVQNVTSNTTITWGVSDSNVASISSNGVLTVKKHGYVTITATLNNGKVFPKFVMVGLPQYKIKVNPQSGCYDVLFYPINENASEYQMFTNKIRIESALKKANVPLAWEDCPNAHVTLYMTENGSSETVYFRASYVDDNNIRTESDTYYTAINTSFPYIIEPNYIKVQSQSILNSIVLKPNPNFKYEGTFPQEFKIYNVICHGKQPVGQLNGVTTLTLSAQNLFPQSMIDNILSHYNLMSISDSFSLVGSKGNIIQTIRVSMTRN